MGISPGATPFDAAGYESTRGEGAPDTRGAGGASARPIAALEDMQRLLSQTHPARDIVVDEVISRARRLGGDAAMAVEALEQRLRLDPLTGLANRPHFLASVEGALEARGGGSARAVLLLDLDHFQWVNDTLGQIYGDLLLLEATVRIRGAIGADDLAARIGSDEFAVLLADGEVANADRMARKILALLGMPYELAGRSIEIGASAGLALTSLHGEDVATLLGHAAASMHRAKATGRRYVLADLEQEPAPLSQLALVGDLREALAHDHFFLAYQPLLAVDDGRIHSVETLVRWQHPRVGLIPPDRFIGLAEQTGMIDLLTLWVLEAALRQVQAWEGRDLVLDVAVNISMHSLLDVQFPDTVTWLLRRYGVAPSRLTLEITESTVMEQPERSRDILERLADLDIRLAIDDFGTGYSSLAYLKQLPVHSIKIDKSFVQGMAGDQRDQAIVRTIVDLAHGLGRSVVAEGLEDRDSWHLLAEAGCDLVQGYSISRPLTAPNLERWLRDTPGVLLTDC